MYVANHYIRIGKEMLVRGERIPENLADEKIEWLLEAGAISEIAPLENQESRKKSEVKNKKEPGTAAAALAEDLADDEEEEEQDTPEIDVMDGIVAEGKPEKGRGKTK